MRLSRDPILLTLFLLVILSNAAYLHRVPGLMGDEASEGENVYELLSSGRLTILGERSYIGPLIDYLRVPFIRAFGYTALALRLPMLIVTSITFWLAASVCLRVFGRPVSYYALAALFLSPIYLSQQRLGWAITLLPLFAVCLTWLLTTPQLPQRALLAGLIAGVGLHTHILFLPTLVAVLTAAAIGWIIKNARSGVIAVVKEIRQLWPGVIGFVAGVSTQAAILRLHTDDQGEPGQVAQLFSARLEDLPSLLPLIISSSSYVARYTGREFTPTIITALTATVLAFVALGLLLSPRKRAISLGGIGLIIEILVLLVIIDRFALRYFVIPMLGLWTLAGLGLGSLLVRARKLTPFAPALSLLFAGGLIMVSAVYILVPFLKTGGSVADFSLGNRTNSARDLVDIRPLLQCLAGANSVASENIHIANRLQYVAHESVGFVFSASPRAAQWLVHYREESPPSPENEHCPELRHFRVVTNS